MSIMVTEVYEALVSAGADEAKAKAAASAIPVGEKIATKQDIGDVKQEIADAKAELKQEIADVKAGLKQEIADVKAGLKQEIADVKAELKQEIADLKAELKQDIAAIKQDIAVLKFAVFTFGPVIIGLLIKLVFFP